MFETHVAIVGGCGRVGLPLGLSFAEAGLRVVLHDIDEAAVETVRSGKMPFSEDGADEALERGLSSGRLTASVDPSSVTDAEHVIIVVGTPIDKHLNPDPRTVLSAVERLCPHLRDGQHLVLRSTVYPGVTAMVERVVEQEGLDIDVTFCPERIAQGRGLEELNTLPEIVSGRTDRARRRAEELFGHLGGSIVPLEVEEAELAKLFTNTWRYIKFAAANQMYMIANDFGLDFEQIRAAMVHDYPRAADIPRAGFAAGPCLLKDTMQLAAFNKNNFTLGHSAMLVNEGLPLYVVSRLERRYDLSEMTVGLLGMAFKADSDDIRSSLSYKLKRLLLLKTRRLLCTDPHVRRDPELVSLEQVLEQADLLIVGAPHRAYASIRTDVPIIDVWNLFGNGVRV